MAWEIAMTTWTVLSKLGHSIVDPVTHKYKLLQHTRDSRKQMYNEEVKTFVVNIRLILHFSPLLKSWCAIPYSLRRWGISLRCNCQFNLHQPCNNALPKVPDWCWRQSARSDNALRSVRFSSIIFRPINGQ